MKTKHILFSFTLLALMALGLAACQKEQLTTSTEGQGDAALFSSIEGMTTDYLSSVELSTNKDGRWKQIIVADLKGALKTFIMVWDATSGSEIQVEISLAASVVGGAAASIAASVDPSGGNSGGHHIHVPIENPENSFNNHGRMHYVIVEDVLVNYGNHFDADDHLLFQPYLNHAFGMMEEEGLLTQGHRNHVPGSVLEANHADYLGSQSLIAYMNGLNDPGFLPGDQAILAQYFGALMASTDPDQFAAYSIAIENQITASTLAPKSKALLLMEMATARYGIAYWM